MSLILIGTIHSEDYLPKWQENISASFNDSLYNRSLTFYVVLCIRPVHAVFLITCVVLCWVCVTEHSKARGDNTRRSLISPGLLLTYLLSLYISYISWRELSEVLVMKTLIWRDSKCTNKHRGAEDPAQSAVDSLFLASGWVFGAQWGVWHVSMRFSLGVCSR